MSMDPNITNLARFTTPLQSSGAKETGKAAASNLDKSSLLALASANSLVKNSSSSTVLLAKLYLAFKNGPANLSARVTNSSFVRSVKDAFSQMRTGSDRAAHQSVDKQSGADRSDKKMDGKTQGIASGPSVETSESEPPGEELKLECEEVINKYEMKFGEIVVKEEKGELSKGEKIIQLKETIKELEGDARLIGKNEYQAHTKLLGQFIKELEDTITQTLGTPKQENLEAEKQELQLKMIGLRKLKKNLENAQVKDENAITKAGEDIKECEAKLVDIRNKIKQNVLT